MPRSPFANQESTKGISKDCCFPEVNGIVHMDFEYRNKQVVLDLPVYEGVFIHDAYRGKDGETLAHSAKGIGQKALVTGIYRETWTDDAADDRAITVHFLKQIDRAIKANLLYVDTVFGFKFIFYEKKKQQAQGRLNDLDL